MAWIAPALLGNLNQENQDSLRDAIASFEQEIGAPVRVMEPGDTRIPSRMLGSWNGNSGNMRHYEGFTEEDRDERGISISFYTWNTEQGEPRYRMIQFPGDMFTRHGAGQGGNTQRQAEAGVELEWFTNSTEEVETAEGVALTFDDNTEPWGALYGGRALYIGIGVYSVCRWGIPNWDAWLFQPIREAADPAVREEAARRREARSRRMFEELMQDQGNIAVTALRTELNMEYDQFAEAQERIVNLKANIDQRNRQLEILLEQDGELTPEQIEREWTSIHNIAGVRSVMFGQGSNVMANGNQMANPWMRIDTDDLWLEHPRNGRKLPLGQFSLFLNFGLHTVRINNNTMRMEGQWDHPHVREGKLCVGEYGPTITSLLRQRKLAAMTNMVFRILRGVNLDDRWGRNNIRLWLDHDDEQRRAHDWPAWVQGEETHPMLTQAGA